VAKLSEPDLILALRSKLRLEHLVRIGADDGIKHHAVLGYNEETGRWTPVDPGTWRALIAQLAESLPGQDEPLKRGVVTALASGLEDGLDYSTVDEFRPGDFELPVLNGVVDLPSGELLPHAPDNRVTLQAPVLYDPTRRGEPMFVARLREMVEGDTETVEFLQAVFGSCLVGVAPNRMFTILHGLPGCGKTTLVETVVAVVGDKLSKEIPPSLMFKQANPARFDEIRERRMGYIDEMAPDAKFSETFKRITGGGTLNYEIKNGASGLSYRSKATLVSATNFIPAVFSDDAATFGRLALVPVVKPDIGPENANTVAEWVAQEGPEILNWLVDGARSFVNANCHLPPTPLRSQAALQSHRERTDPFMAFLVESTVADPDATTSLEDLYQAYLRATGKGPHPRIKAQVAEMMEEVEGVYLSSKRPKVFQGVKLSAARAHPGVR